MTALGMASGLAEEAQGPASGAGYPRDSAYALPFGRGSSFLACMTNDVDIFGMSIKGPMLHVTLTLAEVTAQREPLP